MSASLRLTSTASNRTAWSALILLMESETSVSMRILENTVRTVLTCAPPRVLHHTGVELQELAELDLQPGGGVRSYR